MEMCLVGFLKTFSVKNIFPSEPKNKNNKISFSVENKNLILGKMET